MKTMQEDRVSYSYGFKSPGVEQYSSINVNVSYSTDVREGETPEQALARAKAFVLAETDHQAAIEAPATMQNSKIEMGIPTSSKRVEDEAFDPNNQTHFKIVQNVFDFLNIRSEKARSYKMHVLLIGHRVGDLRRIVEEDELNYAQEAASQPFRIGKNDKSKSNWDGKSPRKRW